MNNEHIYENIPAITNNEEKLSKKSNLSRFPDNSTNLNSNQLENTSRIISASDVKETYESEEKKHISRWDNAWKAHEEKQQDEINQTSPRHEKTKENINTISTCSTFSTSIDINDVYVKEFIPKSVRDPIFSILRDIFVRSFDQYYKQIETQLSLKSDRSLIQWLDDTFNEEQEAILSRKYRCFLLCGNENQKLKEIVLGFLTLKEEEEGSIYIAQVAVRLDYKRRGYGAQLLQHLRNIYPPNTKYWGLCRRANRPALQFYLKQGAIFMTDDDIALKYKYDPKLYAGFEFVDTIPVIASHTSPLTRIKPSIDNSVQQSIIISNELQNIQDISSTYETSEKQDLKEPKKPKPTGCCSIF